DERSVRPPLLPNVFGGRPPAPSGTREQWETRVTLHHPPHATSRAREISVGALNVCRGHPSTRGGEYVLIVIRRARRMRIHFWEAAGVRYELRSYQHILARTV